MKYAANTSVSVEKSKAEIEKTLQRYGANQFMSGWDNNRAYIGFRINNKMVKFVLDLPDIEEFSLTPSGRKRRNRDDQLKAWEQSCRQRWRALALAIKAKLEVVESGISSFEDEFLSFIILPDGKTAGEFLKPQIEEAYKLGSMPKLIPFLEANGDD